jgi:hypothetical protein
VRNRIRFLSFAVRLRPRGGGAVVFRLRSGFFCEQAGSERTWPDTMRAWVGKYGIQDGAFVLVFGANSQFLQARNRTEGRFIHSRHGKHGRI